MIIYRETDEGVGDLLWLRLIAVHPAVTGAGPHSLWSSLDHLQVVGRSPRTYCHGDLIVEHVDNQVETDCLLPVNVRVSYGKLLAISPPDLHGVSLTRAQALPNKEQEVVAVDGSVWLEEEVADEEICPVRCVAGAAEPGVLNNIFFIIWAIWRSQLSFLGRDTKVSIIQDTFLGSHFH